MDLSAKWIWRPGDDGRGYNIAAEFRREFQLGDFSEARIAVSADSYYRLKINGRWVNDGPSRAWPEHYQYDWIDVSHCLRSGINTIEAVVRYFGSGTFHQRPQRGGFLAELKVKTAAGLLSIATDEEWQARAFPFLIANTAKISVQQAPVEVYDAMRKVTAWQPAAVIAAAGEGPWQNLEMRDCRLLSRREFPLARFVSARRSVGERLVMSWQARRLYRPGSISDNRNDFYPSALLLTVATETDRRLRFAAENLTVAIDGRPASSPCRLAAGEHLLIAAVADIGAHTKDHTLVIYDPESLTFGNPAGPRDTVSFAVAPALTAEAPDIPWPDNPRRDDRVLPVIEWRERLFAAGASREALRNSGLPVWQLRIDDFNVDDGFWRAMTRETVEAEIGDAVNPGALLYRDGEPTTVVEGVELLYDFGEQNIGYWEFEVDAAAGTTIDLYAVEYIDPAGNVQPTYGNRNVLRYTCREGRQHFVSYKRRSGRYLYCYVSNAARPVKFNYLGLIESTYPVQRIGSFHCSREDLNRIWAMSERTLKLCMEDTYTDCPLYEQTLWVGDARSESLFAYPVFGAYDLARRCIVLAGRSLERFPIVGCQVPSSWDCLLPAWSFMWSMSVHDYYFETGDRDFVRKVWPMVRDNIEGALGWLDPVSGLFVSREWNMFDWSPTDCNQPVVMQLSMFLAGALDAALKLGRIAGDTAWCEEYARSRADLANAIDRAWDEERGQWPDYLDEAGVPATRGSVHTSMLALLYDLVTDANRAAAIQNVLEPPDTLYRVCSPFASLYYYMTLEKLGEDAAIIAAIERDYREMLKLDESTVWETYLSLAPFEDGRYFPTRSHCHGWSAAPLYYLPRTVLGVKAAAVGATAFTVSPLLLDGMTHASGRIATVSGALHIAWELRDGRLTISATPPPGCTLTYRPNGTHAGLDIVTNW